MTSHTGRLYTLALALLVFFLAWAAFAARPWSRTANGASVKALAAREQRLHRQSLAVQRIVTRRWAVYRAQLRHRRALNAAAPAPAPAPSVRVVTLPPLTITRTS
ncbi:MAG TPA: hypothetical protein VFB35_07655 [Gaiellaceae bacterium]|nr:hypothetical protein [Gaiellaceae bacterium]